MNDLFETHLTLTCESEAFQFQRSVITPTGLEMERTFAVETVITLDLYDLYGLTTCRQLYKVTST